MAEWNLSVRLSGQGTGLARTLRTLSRDATTASRDVAALRRDITLLRNQARNNIKLKVKVDGSGVRRDVQRALSAAGTGQGLTVDLRLGDASQLRRDVRNAVRWAAWGHRIEIPIGLRDPNALRTQVTAAVQAAARNQTIRVRVQTDTSDLNNLNRAVNNAGSGGGKGGGALASLLTLIPAVIPLAAGLTNVIAPLVAELGAAGVASGAFGAALAGQLGPMKDVADAQTKYEEAVRDNGASSEKAIEAQLAYQRQLKALPPATQRASVAFGTLKSTFTDWSDDMARFTMAPVEDSFAVLEQVIPRLSPLVQDSSTQLSRLITVAGGAVASPGFDALANRFTNFAGGAIQDVTDDLIHMIRVISSGQAGDGAVGEILDYIRQAGPAAKETLHALAGAVANLLEAGAQAGPTMLTLVNAVLQLVAALPPGVVAVIIQAASALKLLQLAGAGAAAVAGGFATFGAKLRTMATAALGASGTLAGLRAAFMSLSVAARASVIVAAIGALAAVLIKMSEAGKAAPPDIDKLTTSLKQLGSTGKVTGELARSFGSDLGQLHDKVSALTSPSNAEKVQQFLVSWTGWDSTPVKDAKDHMDALDKSLADMVKNGDADLAAAAVKRLTAEYGKGGRNTAEFRKQLDDYKSALADQKFEQQLAAESMGLFGQAAIDTKAKLDAQKQSADGLRQSIQALNNVNREGLGGQIAFQAAIDAAADAAKKNAGALDMQHGKLVLNTEKQRDAASALNDLAQKTDEAAASARESGASWASVNGIYEQGRAALVKSAQQMGLTRQEAAALADQILKTPSKTAMLKADISDWKSKIAEADTQLKTAKGEKKAKLTADIADWQAKVAAAQLQLQGTHATKEAKLTANITDWQAKIANAQVQLLTAKGEKRATLTANIQDWQAKVTAAESQLVKARASKKATLTANIADWKAKVASAETQLKTAKGSKRATLTANIADWQAKIRSAQGQIAALPHSKSVTLTITKRTVLQTIRQGPSDTASALRKQADSFSRANGGVTDYYADGGTRTGDKANQHVAQIAPAGAWRVWAEPETGGEGYVPLAASKRPRSRAITMEIVRRLGGDPSGIEWYANGSNFTYSPSGAVKSVSDVQSSYSNAHQPISKDDYNKKIRARANAVDSLRAAEARLAQVRKHKHTHTQLLSAENAVAKARRSLATATEAAQSAEARYKKTFSLSDWSKTLASTVSANNAYEANLSKIASRGGADVIEQLRGMGAEGASMVSALAKATTSQFNSIVSNLRKLGPLAKATLTDFTNQLNTANKTSATFQANIAKLAAMGYGSLATQLAGQGDEAAQAIAAQAVKSSSAASKANAAAKTQAATLSGDDLANLVQVIAAITTSSTGIHDVAKSTGLGEDTIIDIATRARSQVQSSLGSRSTKFLADLSRAQQHLSYADGGIRAGLYASRSGLVRFAEPETGGEAYVPLGASKRGSAMPVLADVARRFGVGLTDAHSGRPVVIVQGGDTLTVHVPQLRSDASPSEIAAQVARQYRRAKRGGVQVRA